MGLRALGVLLQDEQLLFRQRWQCQVPQRASPAQGPASNGPSPRLSWQLMLLQGQVAIISIHWVTCSPEGLCILLQDVSFCCSR